MNFLKSNPIDLNDYSNYLTPYKRDRHCVHCPNCDGKLSISPSNGEKFTCWSGGCDRSDIRKAVLNLAGENDRQPHSPELEAKLEAKAQQRLEDERTRIAGLMTAPARHNNWLDITSNLKLSDPHRQVMLDRGWSPESIELSNARSSAKGRIIPILTAEGLMVGSQVILNDSNEKRWYGEEGTNRLKETDELPLAVIQPQNCRQEVSKKTGRVTGYIAFTESTLDKPWLCSQNFGMVTIGSSKLGSQPNDLKRSIETLKAKYGWDDIKYVLMADGGSVVNDGVMGDYRKLNEQIKALDGELLVGWWGQYTKQIGDIDEIGADVEIKLISFEKFELLSQDRQAYVELSHLSIAPKEIRNERFLSAFTPEPGKITFVSSPCATGKTTRLKSVVGAWKLANPDGKIIDITQLNSIRESHQKELGLQEWRVGYGMDDFALNDNWGVSLCGDSLRRLQLESIPARSLLVIDEVEAVLKHFAMGGTLGNNAAAIQAHFTDIIDRILVTGGAVVGLEDDLTDLSVKGMQDLVDSRYPIELIVNTYQPFKWNVSIGRGKNEHFLSSLLGRLADGERIFMPNSSQKNGEATDRLVKEYLPELAEKIDRVDSKTAPQLGALLANPNLWMKGRDTRLLTGSPTIQSGFNLSNNQFDRTVARFTNLDTRAHIQMLHRDRSNTPRDIYTTKRGVEAGGRSKAVAKLERMDRDIAQRASLSHGYGALKTNRVGNIWNHLNAQFAARESLSAAYLEDYLRCELADRGHIISPADWVADARFTDVGERFKEIKEEILVEENKILHNADGRSITVKDAIAILHSSGVPFEIRQKAIKCQLHDELPVVEFTEDFLMETYTRHRGKYLRECKLNFFLDKHALAKSLDRDHFLKQLDQPHIINSKVSKLAPKIDLLAPIAAHLEDLASGREYQADDPAVMAIQALGLKEGRDFYLLFGLVIKAEEIDALGKKQNSPVATTNKILKQLGYKIERTKQLGCDKERISVFQVTNAECQHRQTIYQALTYKHKNYTTNSTQSDMVVTHTLLDVTLTSKSVCVNPDFDTKLAQEEETPNHICLSLVVNSEQADIEDEDAAGEALLVGDRVRYVGQSRVWLGSLGKVITVKDGLYDCDFMGMTAKGLSRDELALTASSLRVAA